MLVISEVWRDPRVEREARSLARAGYHVKLVYPDFFSKRYDIAPLDWGPNVSFRPLPDEYHLFIYRFPWFLGDGILQAACEERPYAFHCHDLTTSLIGLSAAKAVGAYCVCDFHEWFSENLTWSEQANGWIPHPWPKRFAYKLAEALVLRQANAVITVCESIAKELTTGVLFPRRDIAVVRNIPKIEPAFTSAPRNLRREIGVNDDTFVLLWQGGIGPSRHIEPIIEAMRFVDGGVFVIRGPHIDQFGPEYMQLARELGIEDRVICLSPVPSADVVEAAIGADAGVWSLPNLCRNFYYALPNKIFEYMAAGLPIVGANFPEVRKIIERYDIGLCFDPYDPKSIAAQINHIVNDRARLQEFRKNIPAALSDMQADREWDKLVQLYDDLDGVQTVVEPMNETFAWLARFPRRRGRPLRVLHIGNIANNAYNNAKIQRAYGIEADVLSFDYYHIMACPEWEDGNFSGKIENEDFPDWWGVELNGYKRPRWFVQGPLDISVRYLLARVTRSRWRSPFWYALEFERWLICRRTRSSDRVRRAIERITGRATGSIGVPGNGAFAERTASLVRRLLASRFMRSRWLNRRLEFWAGRLARFVRMSIVTEGISLRMRAMVKYHDGIFGTARECLLDGRKLQEEDVRHPFIWWWHPYLRLLLSRYDIVQCYATYTIMPFIIGRRDYIAYEHGTIRTIPFQDTAEGRMCAVTYRTAAMVFVTNSDNIEAAEKLRLSDEQIVSLPHAFDSDKLLRFAEEVGRSQVRPDTPTTFFSPTRQHWVDCDPGWAKGNDRTFHAVRLLKNEGLRLRLRVVAWGRDLDASRELVDTLGIDDMVQWLPTMKKRELWIEYLEAAGVLDQFVVPAIGGVTFEAMMLARPVITAIDQDETSRFFGEPPPVFSCRTTEEIAAAMRAIVKDPSDNAGRGQANQTWMQKLHSSRRIVELQVNAYRRILSAEHERSCQCSVLEAPS